jgi:hypothetical protein
MGVILAVLIGGGLLTFVITRGGANMIPGVSVQTSNPVASATYMTPEQGVWFLVWAVFLTFGPLVTLAAVLSLGMWWLNRGVVRAREMPRRQFEFTLDASRPNTLGGVLARNPMLTIALAVLTIILIAAVAAVGFGVFR